MVATLDDGMVHCPRCGSANTHHRDIVVYTRPVEDDPVTLVTTISSEFGVTEAQIMRSGAAANPSGRRQGLRIEFWCEDCGGSSPLCIAQHKGQSLLSWGVCDEASRRMSDEDADFESLLASLQERT